MSLKKIERIPSAYDYPLIIKNLIKTPLIYSPSQEIVYQDKIRYDYTVLKKRIAKLANALESMGVKQGDTIGIMDWDSHRYLECFFAVPMMGCVLHTVNIKRAPENLLHTINHAQDDIILVNTDFIPLLESVKDKFEKEKKIILLNDNETRPDTHLEITGEYEDLLSRSSSDYEFPDFDENTMATIIYTTGSTGTPKAVGFSHRQLVMHTMGMIANFCAYRSEPNIDSGDVYMPLTPMFHVHAWGLPYFFTMLGAKQVYPGKYKPENILKLIADEGVTFSHCVPTLMHMLLECPEIKKVNLSSLKVVVAGAALSENICRSAMNHGISVFSGYGMSESGPFLSITALKPYMKEWDIDKQVKILCRAGLPVPMADLEVVDIMGKAVPHDGKSIGEVVARAPWLAQAYINDPAKSEKLWIDGWLHTGDIGFIDQDGYLKITDRIKDAIKTGGEWIASMELEDIICNHEAVSEAAVTAIPDEKWGEKPLALVVLKQGFAGKVDEEDIRKFCMQYVENGTLPAYGVPDKIAIVDTIPKTSVGKISKKQMRRQHTEAFNLEDGP